MYRKYKFLTSQKNGRLRSVVFSFPTIVYYILTQKGANVKFIAHPCNAKNENAEAQQTGKLTAIISALSARLFKYYVRYFTSSPAFGQPHSAPFEHPNQHPRTAPHSLSGVHCSIPCRFYQAVFTSSFQ